MKKAKRPLALLLCVCLLLGSGGASVLAADGAAVAPSATDRTLYSVADWAAVGLINLIRMLIPGKPVCKYEQSPDFYPGQDGFRSAPEAGARWNLGYARAPLLTDDIFDGKHYVGGGLVGPGQTPVIDAKTPTELIDNQLVRVVALSDGGTRGTVIFAVIDGFGITSADVRRVRAKLAENDYVKTHNIVSINVSVLHQHSEIDTLGMNGPILPMVFLNPVANVTGLFQPYSGKNPGFMQHLYTTVTDAVKAAVADMKPGTLSYGAADMTEYIRDKREPLVFDSDLHRLRFTPDPTAQDPAPRETWIANLAIHCTGNGAAGRELTGDYPYYMEQVISDPAGPNANFLLIQGAQLAITLDTSPIDQPDQTALEKLRLYGEALGGLLAGIQDTPVTPLLNIAHKEYAMPIDNPLHLLFFKLGAVEATVSRANLLGTKLDLITEVGYLELGDQLSIAICPGETEPALAFGGGLTAAQAWKGEDWAFTPMKDDVPAGRKLIVFGLTNDHCGYNLLKNDVHPFVQFGNEEVNAASTLGGERLVDAFAALTASVRG
ncbi:MAG: hypothetical protein LBJ11_04750 [Oscillospiraceae bacterium]|jgi:hypothetical protein|nr:hypothetical protein [Oscillospiraceae bacterium]